MKISRLTILKNTEGGKLAAYFDLELDSGIIIKGFRILNGRNGIIVAHPNEKGKDGKYYDKVLFPQEFKEKFHELALQEYNNKLKENS